MDNRNCLTWEEWIRLSDIDHPQVLRMQDIILEQEKRIAELESVIDDKNHLLDSFDFETLERELFLLEKYYCPLKSSPMINITKILDNYKLRIQQ